ncbi:MAG: InlB B-repeat-containing protein [Bacilli bacterium]|nr:InlB B-repeat-containing protein [Bacilli bacterium]
MKKIVVFLLTFILVGCKPKQYTINFYLDNGEIMDSITVSSGDTIEEVEPPSKEGYIFVSWQKDGINYNEKSPVYEDLNLTATWIEEPDLSREYKVIFNNNGKEEEVIVKRKNLLTKPKDPSIKYYNFIGWYSGDKLYDFNTPVTKDLYLVAKFERKVLTVTFELDGGSGISERQIDAGKKLIVPDVPTKLGYNFVGWYLLGKEYNFNSVVTKDITLVAKWEPINYITVRFDPDGGTIIKSQVVESGKKLTIPESPRKEGYTFLYWGYEGKKFDFSTKITEPITLLAIYEPETVPDMQ